MLNKVITPQFPRLCTLSSHLPGTCCCESANWPPVEPDSNSAPPRTRVASCIPVFRRRAARRLEPARSPRRCFFPGRKSFVTAARLPPAPAARALADRPDSSDCSAPASAAALACKALLHLRQRKHANRLYHALTFPAFKRHVVFDEIRVESKKLPARQLSRARAARR